MVTTEELIPIVAGSVAGLLVLMVTIAICVYCCRRQKKESRKNVRRFQPLPHGNDASKHSTLNGVDPRSVETRLPKVGSNGLWMGTPSMYATPHPYYVDRQPDRNPKRSSSLQRASSEERLHQSRGHQVYGGGNVHLYHSNPYYYEPYGLPRSNSYLNMYGGYPPYPSGSNRDSRAMLVEYPDGQEYIYDPYRDVSTDRHHGKKVKRTHSDLTGTKRKKREKRRESPFEGRKNRSTEMLNKNSGSDRIAPVDVHNKRQRDPSILQTTELRKPKERSEQTATIEIHDNELSECATDSAKIRAMQGRNNEPEPISKKWEVKEDLRLDLPSDINDDPDDLQFKSYQYNGKNREEVSIESRGNNGGKIGYSNSAFVDNEKRESSSVHKRLEKRESNTDGKQVSAAFDFLKNYMSDDEETVFADSRRQSPLHFDT